MTEASLRARILRHPFAILLSARPEGRACHAVGGSVRDAALGLEVTDLDLSVAQGGESLAQALAEASGGRSIALGGNRFASYRVVAGRSQADVWDRRGGSLHADLERRDLTVNSIACPLLEGALEDPFGGLDDLESRTLKATKLDCFERDALRVLRLARFRATLHGFSIEGETVSAAREAAPGLAETAVERVRVELELTLAATPSHGAFQALADLDVWRSLLPPLATGDTSERLCRRAERLDRFAALIESGVTPELRLVLAVALILAAGTLAPEPMAGEIQSRQLLARSTVRRALPLVEKLPASEPSELRLFLARHGHDWRLAFAASAAVAAEGSEPPDVLGELSRHLGELARSEPSLLAGPPPLLTGHQIGAILDSVPGPAIGRASRRLQREQALGRIRSRAEAEAFIRGLA